VQLRRRARRRLIGAITLVTVMVVALPMVLDGEPKQSGQDIEITIPPQTGGGEFSSKIVPAPEQPKPAPAPAEKSAAVEAAAPAVQPESGAKKAETPSVKGEEKNPEVAVAAKPAKTEETASKTPPAEAKSKPKEAPHKDEKTAAKPDGGTFVIQLGAFASMANAKERQAKLTALKIKFYTETVKTPTGERLRVRAGPYATRQDAERVQAKLKGAGIQDGVVAEKKE
ncbi:MAG: SPOR domain-containing protein, partial [Sulfuricella sp.]|nr:SPOR domain-containing protein [Sulfuricella sp.]